MAENPFIFLSAVNVEDDIRRPRRALEKQDFDRLIETTAASPKTYRKLNSKDRALLYLTASQTGFRASELASVTVDLLELDGPNPVIHVLAGYSKRRKYESQPIRADLAELLKEWVTEKQQSKSDGKVYLWPGKWIDDPAEMLRRDLKAAGIVYQDEAGLYFDFHALRHQFVSNLVAANIHPKTAQVLARHSSITLTMDRYAHLQKGDAAQALNLLPATPVFFAMM